MQVRLTNWGRQGPWSYGLKTPPSQEVQKNNQEASLTCMQGGCLIHVLVQNVVERKRHGALGIEAAALLNDEHVRLLHLRHHVLKTGANGLEDTWQAEAG